MAEWTAYYIDHQTGINRNTRTDYRSILRTAIEGSCIADIAITELERRDMEGWITELEDGGTLSAGSVGQRHALLAGALGRAVRERKIAEKPARGVKWTRTQTTEQMALTPTEFRDLLDLMPEHYRTFIEFLAETGTRFNEATALRPSDVNREAGTVRITRNMRKIRGGGGYEVGDN